MVLMSHSQSVSSGRASVHGPSNQAAGHPRTAAGMVADQGCIWQSASWVFMYGKSETLHLFQIVGYTLRRFLGSGEFSNPSKSMQHRDLR